MLDKKIHQDFLKKNGETKFDEKMLEQWIIDVRSSFCMKLDTAVSVHEPLSHRWICKRKWDNCERE